MRAPAHHFFDDELPFHRTHIGIAKTRKGEIIDAKTETELDQYRGKLHKAIVMLNSPRAVKALFDPPAKRQTDESLLALANSIGVTVLGSPVLGSSRSADGSQPPASSTVGGPSPADDPAGSSGPAGRRSFGGTPEQRAAYQLQSRKLQMAYEEGAAVLLECGRGDGGTMFVGSASLPRAGSSSGDPSARRPGPWSKETPEILPQVVVAVEHYNRIIRMLQKGSPVELEIDIASRFYEDDLMSFNVVAEIPGSDLGSGKRCQEPFLGRPRGRRVLSRPSRLTVRCTQVSLP